MAEMAELETIINAITQVGFPIVMCLILMKYCSELNDKHKAETDKVVEAVNECTAMINKLLDKFEALDRYFLQVKEHGTENE